MTLVDKSGGIWPSKLEKWRLKKRMLRQIEVANDQLSDDINQVEDAIDKALERNKISTALFIGVQEAKEFQTHARDALGKKKKTGSRHLNYTELLEKLLVLYSQIQQLKEFDRKDEQHFYAQGQYVKRTEFSWPTRKDTRKSSKDEKVQRMKSGKKLEDSAKGWQEFSQETLIQSQKTKKLEEIYPKDDVNKIGQSSVRDSSMELIPRPQESKEKDISLESKDQQHVGENVVKSDSAKSSTSQDEVEHQDETEMFPPPTDLSAAPSEEKVGQKKFQVYEAKGDHEAGSMKLSPSIQEEHGAAQFPGLSKPVLQLEDEVVSAAYPSTQMEPKATTPEVERILQLEQVDGGSGSSQSNDTPGTAFNIRGAISSGAESGNKPPILSTDPETTTLVSISVEGELSQFMDISLEIPRGTSLSKWQNLSNGFLRWDFLSGKENYRILARDKTVELELDRGKSSDTDYSSPEPLESFNLANSTLPKHLVFRNEGDKMKKPPNEDQWKQAGVMDLTDTFPSLPKKLYSLPQKLYSPNLVLLFLQRNPSLRPIPESLFSAMPSLRVVDLSDNRFRSLPSSIFGLHKLQVLILRDCSFIYMFPPEIKGLEHIEVLDLLGTELEKAPDELGQLTNLRHLQISFYGTDDGRESDHLPNVLLSSETVSKLQHLEALTIVVHPEDLRWVKNAEAIMQDIGNLENLSYLHFYFTKVEIMERFIRSPAWKIIGSNKFKFVVGQDVKRIVDRVSGDVEHKFNEQDRCLRFVNGKEVPEAVENVLSYVTAFYLDHHSAVCSLSEFGITNSRQLSFCVVRECPNIEFIISEIIDEPAYPSLEYLGLHYLWKLESICKDQPHKGSFRALKSLTVATCPKLEYIFSGSLAQCFCNLEELIVEDCESLKEIIERSDEMGNDDFSALPRLRKIKLYYLPQLFRLLYEGERSLEDPLPSRDCQLESVTLHSCPKLDRSLLKQPLVKELIEEDYKLAT
ncbi:uncharacterized protein [Coffea arabica]|uniref:Uncharacterized protein LOC113735026 n=1 Tax=Coffea arabica TaxID=13443 RepID=A0A6P6WQY0_COFAR|nr:uncharacterized protein LOC113735026 [Coffea arabica]XP_027117705.1 uncharacterized protein LOC113735026 [Coffea arabica]XP_027117706.1 uncharacterized protein LOC113735026 [Coffea arabica]